MAAATIAGSHGLRVTARWLNIDDLFPTYGGLLIKHTTGTGTPTYAGLITDYVNYAFMLNNSGASGVEVEEDLSCDVSGIRIRRGRDSIGESVQAGTLSMTINDKDGKHDPRNPPAGPSRTGSKILVEVDPKLSDEWVPIFDGFVEHWGRTISASDGDHSEVDVNCADAFSILGRAVSVPLAAPVGGGEVGSSRVIRLLGGATWVEKWGDLNVTGGYNAMNPTKLDGAVLDAIHDTTRSEDGIFYVEPDGTIFWYDRYWRGTRRFGAAVIDITGEGTVSEFGDMARLCPSSFAVTDDDLDMVNRAIVWRSVEFDPTGTQVAKRSQQDIESISMHGTLAKEYSDLPHAADSVSQWLADRLVARLAGETNDIGEFEVTLTRRIEDADVVSRLGWGDQILVWDDKVTGIPETYPYEFVGIEHNITPDKWDVTISVDRWIAESSYSLPPAGVVSGVPGHFTPVGAMPPENLARLQQLGALGQGAAWPDGHYVWLADGSRASWNGSAWVKGAKNDPTGVTPGLPGTFTPSPASIIPGNLAVLRSIGPLGQTTTWRIGQYVVLADASNAWWNGTQWMPGRAPAEATAGTPGTLNPASSTFTSAAGMNIAGVTAVPTAPWAAGTYITVTGPEAEVHWNGYAWLPGDSPGYPSPALVWDTGKWGLNTWA